MRDYCFNRNFSTALNDEMQVGENENLFTFVGFFFCFQIGVITNKMICCPSRDSFSINIYMYCTLSWLLKGPPSGSYYILKDHHLSQKKTCKVLK